MRCTNFYDWWQRYGSLIDFRIIEGAYKPSKRAWEAGLESISWRCIDSAPLDGTEVDLYAIDGTRVINARYVRGHWVNKFGVKFKRNFVCWMPIPNAPTGLEIAGVY